MRDKLVVAHTAHTEVGHVIQARDAGMTEYLTKPVSAKKIYQRISVIVESKRSFVRNAEFFGPDRRRRTKEVTGEDRREAGKKAVD